VDLSIVVDGQSIWLPAVFALGAGVGLVAGMFGVGGGFLLVPLLHVLLGIPFPVAVGAALCQTVATGLGALLRYRRMGHAEARFDLLLIGGSVLGVDAGARLLTALEGGSAVSIGGLQLPVVQVAVVGSYTVLFLSIAALLWWRTPPSTDRATAEGPLARIKLPPTVRLPVAQLPSVSGPVVGWIGLANGVIAGLIGIGGGILLIPLMLYGFGFDIRKTAGTGLVVVLLVGIVGTVEHAILGNVYLSLAVPLMVGSALAAQVGAGLTRSLPATVLRRALAIVLLVTLAALFAKLFR
jgi:uncharacterized membrane protein YfcA